MIKGLLALYQVTDSQQYPLKLLLIKYDLDINFKYF